MNTIKRILLISILLIPNIVCFAQKKQPSYEYRRGVEALTERNDEKEAMEYFQKDLGLNPKNGYSYYWMARVYYNNNQYGDALTCVNNAVKYLPSSDDNFCSNAYFVLCNVLLSLEDTVKAMESIDKAVKISKKEELYRNKRGRLYLQQGKLDLAKKDFEYILKNNEAYVSAYLGLGLVDLRMNNIDRAIENFTKAVNLDNKFQDGYSWRALAYELKLQYNEALNDHITALYLGFSAFDYDRLLYISSFRFSETLSRLESVASKDKTTSMWDHIIGSLYEDNGQYEVAIEWYTKGYEQGRDDYYLGEIAKCYTSLGNYACALRYINDAIEVDKSEASYYISRADIHDMMGNYQDALDDLDKAINLSDEGNKYFTYHHKGWLKKLHDDSNGALKDFNKSIALEKNYSYNYLCRGTIYNDLGFSEEARKDFQKVISIERDTLNFSARPYAHFYLGQTVEAKHTMAIMLRHKGDNYDAACLYSLLGETSIALDYLEKALQNGFRKFVHIERDHDLDNIRNTSRFKQMIAKYRALPVVGDCGGNIVYRDTVVMIPFTQEGGVYKVRCSVNGLPLDFIFDTGASDVSLSTNEASFMFKQGYLVANDIRGSQKFRTADGGISVGTAINLRNVNLGGLVLNDVPASVVNNDNAPALLGQSVLNKFGKVEFDYNDKVIKITGKVPVEDAVGNGDDVVSEEAVKGAKELLVLLLQTQENPKRISRYQAERDNVAYGCENAINELYFYNEFYEKNSLESTNNSIREVSRLYKLVFNIINDYLIGEIGELNFSDIISQLQKY